MPCRPMRRWEMKRWQQRWQSCPTWKSKWMLFLWERQLKALRIFGWEVGVKKRSLEILICIFGKKRLVLKVISCLGQLHFCYSMVHSPNSPGIRDPVVSVLTVDAGFRPGGRCAFWGKCLELSFGHWFSTCGHLGCDLLHPPLALEFRHGKTSE